MLTTFEVLAQPIRRSILDRLRDGEHLVGELADALGLTQPLTSKHLRVLRDAGLVDGPGRRAASLVRRCGSSRSPSSTTGWRRTAGCGSRRLDRLGDHLDAMTDRPKETADVR